MIDEILMSSDVWAHVAIFTHFNRIWTRSGRCENVWDKFCIWVELPVQRRLCPIFVRGVGSPDIKEYSAG